MSIVLNILRSLNAPLHKIRNKKMHTHIEIHLSTVSRFFSSDEMNFLCFHLTNYPVPDNAMFSSLLSGRDPGLVCLRGSGNVNEPSLSEVPSG